MKEEQAAAESSSECQVSIHGRGQGQACNPSPGEAGGRVKGAKRLVLTSSSNTQMSADSRGEQLAAFLNLVINSKQKKSELSKTTVIINAK